MKKLFFTLFWLMLLGSLPQIGNAQVSGTVFRDFPMDGTSQNIYGLQNANEKGVAGVTVTVYPGGTSTTTDQDGNWTLPATGKVRVEFSNWPFYLYESAEGGQKNSSVRFVTAPNSNVDFGLHNPADFSNPNPDLVTPKYINGNPFASGNDVAYDGALYLFPNTASGVIGNGGTPYSTIATQGQIGSTWGVAYDRYGKKLYMAAHYKRHAPLGPGETGGQIFSVANIGAAPGTPTTFMDLTVLGINVGAIETNAQRQLSPLKGQASPDLNSFDRVGKVALGDLDISDDGKHLYVVNLHDKKVYQIDIAQVEAGIPNATALPAFNDPGCPNGVARPWGLGYNDGELYLGIVCTAENGGTTDDLRLIVQKYNFNTSSWTEVLNETPNWPKGGIFGNDQIPWQPWEDNAGNFIGQGFASKHPQPVVCDIAFDTEGSMHIVVLDRIGFQLGHRNTTPDGGGLVTGITGGELLRTYKDPVTGAFTLEANASVGPYTSGGTGTGNVGQGGPNTDQGPCDGSGNCGEFYADDYTNGGHYECSSGGLALIKGSRSLASVQMNPINGRSDASGVSWFGINDGLETQSYEIFRNASTPSPDFSKQNGLGDLEYLVDPSPLEIGNHIWEDTNGDGIQDPDESGIQGVTVELVKNGSVIATATTDANGDYIFSNDPNGSSSGSHIYNISALEYGKDYIIRVPTTTGTLSLTTANASGKDIIDSDAASTNGEITVSANDIPISGANNHSFDVGYRIQSNNHDDLVYGCGTGPSGCNVVIDKYIFNIPKTGSGVPENNYTLPQTFKTDGQFKVEIKWRSRNSAQASAVSFDGGAGPVAGDPVVITYGGTGESIYTNGDMFFAEINTGLVSSLSVTHDITTVVSDIDLPGIEVLVYRCAGPGDATGEVVRAEKPVFLWPSNQPGNNNPTTTEVTFQVPDNSGCYIENGVRTVEITTTLFGIHQDGCGGNRPLVFHYEPNVGSAETMIEIPPSNNSFVTHSLDLDPAATEVVVTVASYLVNTSSSHVPYDQNALPWWPHDELIALCNHGASANLGTIMLSDKCACTNFNPNVPTCATGDNNMQWTQEIDAFTGDASEVKLVCNNTLTYTIPASNYPAALTAGNPVTVDVTEVLAYDGYNGRENVTQANEQFRIVFKKNGVVVGTTPYTQDLPDMVLEGSWSGSLGTVTLPAGADEIVIEHWEAENGSCDTPNSLVPVSVCLSVEDNCSVTETHSTVCASNGTPANENDDYFDLTVTATLDGGSGNYVVIVGGYTSPSTASGTAVTILGNGTHTNFAADGSTTYTVRVEDATDSACFVEFTTEAVNPCSNCPTKDCLDVQMKKN